MWRANRVEALLEQLAVLDAADGGAFPYADCRRLGERSHCYSFLIRDLDLYVSELAGYRNGLRDILMWDDETVMDVERRLARSFFERFPQYAGHRAEMTAVDVPALRWILDVAEGTRLTLLELLAIVRRERPTG